ncbi:Mss4-like protein [Violaceomyces palustris]|uniref:Mss4-like protein n=1 Tax=Violaceomyces palustris TaxID=1673888 RepID=A0ACD0NUJ6_9BASI|nr:Mss4-like protein [Violaceomyces palustris]
MHPPPSNLAHNTTSIYQTISSSLSKTSTRSSSSLSSAQSPTSTSSYDRSSVVGSPPQATRSVSTSAAPSSANACSNSKLPKNLSFDLVRPEEVRQAHVLEVQSFPREDAASYEKLIYRQKAAPHLFFGAFVPLPPPKVAGPLSVSGPSRRKLIAYCCATAAPALTLRSMSYHDESEDAHMVCIHSVCVAAEHQRKGLAVKLLENFISRLKRAEQGRGKEGEKGKRGYETLALLAHEELVPLYTKVGFRVQGHSHIQYGSGQWLELRRSLRAPIAARQDSTWSSSGSDRSTSDSSPTSSSSSNPTWQDMPATSQGAVIKAPLVDSNVGPEGTPKENPSDTGSSNTPTTATQAASSASPTKAGPPPQGMPSQASILAALRAQSQPGPNPGISYTAIMGQAIAAKTAAEDAGMALEARLVNREDGTNLARLYCPMENCRCCILSKNAGLWTRKESGPLNNASLELAGSPSPPVGPNFFPLPQQPHTGGGSNSLLTTVRGFWSVSGPLQFDNVGFSRDIKWTAPATSGGAQPNAGFTSARAGYEEGGGVPSSAIVGEGSQKERAKEIKALQKKEEKERAKEQKEQRKKEKKKAALNGGGEDEDVSNLLSHLSLGLTPGEEYTVKYLVCADCECGPLGFTILPDEMQQGRLAAEVGEEIERSQRGEARRKARKQEFYLAADRVRYAFDRK